MKTSSKRTALLISTALGLLFFAGTQAEAQTAAPNTNQAATAGNGGVAEVVVTAEKRTETTLNVPMGITAVTGKSLVRQQAYSLQDFVAQVPGLNLTNGVNGAELVIRGVSTGADLNAPVATYLDDTPIIGVGPFSGGSETTPDLDTYDMNRIEVLKGPQGTLYGADALGGILKYVTNAPDPSGFHASAEAGVSTVDHGGVGDDLHGMINVPLGSDLALRVVGYDNYDPGFINDPFRDLKDINGNRYYGGRASMLWTPTNNFSIRLNTLYQHHAWSDLSTEDLGPPNSLRPVNIEPYTLSTSGTPSGALNPFSNTFSVGNPAALTPGCNLCQERFIAQPGYNTLQYYNGTINWDLGWAKFLSSTTYYDYSYSQGREFSDGYVGLADEIFGAYPGNPFATYNNPAYGKYYVPGAGTLAFPVGFYAGNQYKGTNWVEEARLTSNDQGPLQWLVGIYYTDKTAYDYQPYYPIDITTRSIVYADLFSEYLPSTYQEIAGFGNLDWHITPTFDIAGGVRYSNQHQTFSQNSTSVDYLEGVFELPTTSNATVWTYSADARWHFTPQSMVYARVATGFVPGGPNDAAFNAPSRPPFDASTTTNYEVGLKSSLLDNHLTIDVDGYIIDWSHIQLAELDTKTGYNYLGNGGGATSEGIEWNINYVPIHGLTLDFNGAYDDAFLTQAALGFPSGSRLPTAPMWQLSASGNYEWPVFNDVSGFVGANWQFLGSRYGLFYGPPRAIMPSYSLVDLRAGLETRRWTLTAYVKNVGNVIGLNYVFPTNNFAGTAGPESASVTTPRTVGVEFSANF